MPLLIADGVRVAFAGQDVLHDIDLVVGPGDRLGLVGPNGAGKSTLLRVLAGQLQPDAGRVTATGTVGYLPQEPDRRPDETLGAFLLRRTGVAAAEADMEAAAVAMGAVEGEAAQTAAAADYDEALQRWMDLGGADAESRAAQVLDDLGLDGVAPDTPTAGLSGGQMARAALAATLLSRFDVLLLDEPTNDLDLDGLDRLEAHLSGLRGGLVLISHDRELLSRTATGVLELDPVHATWLAFDGGWEAFLHERQVARDRRREVHDAAEAQRTALVDRVQAAREQSVRGALRARGRASDGDKVQRGARVEAATKGARKVRALESRLGHLDRDLAAAGVVEPRREWQLQLDLPSAPRSGDVVATLRDAVVHRGAFTLGPVDLDLAQGDRVRIVGPNGGGKTTLLRLLLGHLPPDAGTVARGSGVVVGELDQARADLRTGATVVDVLAAGSGLSDGDARTLLAKFGLKGPRTTRPAAALSPGERTRALLAVLMATPTNLLVLDEPTNHLDLPAIEQLEQALDRYAGTVLLVSHDRRLLQAVRTDRTWAVEGGRVRADQR